MKRDLHVLMLEDTSSDAELAERELRKAGIAYIFKRVETRDAFVRALEEFHPDIILSDYKLPDFDGMAALQIVQRDHPEVPMIMVTGALTDIEAVDLIHAGAKDYVLKDRLARLAPAVQRALAAEQSARARQAAEMALRESEAKFRALVESTSDWIWEINEQAIYTYASPQVYELLGYTASEIIGKTPFDLMPPADAVRLKVAFNSLVQGKKPFRLLENANLHKDGRIVFLETSGSPILDSQGVLRGYRGIDRDITERKQAVARIQHMERLLRSIRGINRLITRERDRGKLLQTACELLTGVGGYRRAWISLSGEGPGAVARAGAAEDPAVKPSAPPWSKGQVAAAMDSGQHGFAVQGSCAAIWLVASGTAYGTLNVCLAEAEVFDEEESSLLREVAEDIAFALHAMDLRKQREAALDTLRASEAGLSEAQRIAHLGNWNLDLLHNVLTWSDEIFRIYEINPKQFGASYEAFLEMIHPDDRGMVNNAYTESVKNKTPYNIVHRLLMKDGRVKYVREQCETFYGKDGQPLRSIGTVHDITEQTKAALALQESLARYTTVTESANDAIICLRPDGTIHLWNRMAQQMFGYSAEEAIGKPLHRLIAPTRYHGQADEGVMQFERSGTGKLVGKTTELVGMRRDGAEFPIELSVSAMNIGGEWHATGIVRDITERKRAEEELRASAEKLEHTLSQTIEAVAAMVEARDPYTAGHQRRVAALSSAIAAELGFSTDQIRGLNLAATIHDLGKIRIPAEILSKPGRLDKIEFELIKAHPQAGYDIIKDVQFPWPIAQMVLQHHERLDGSGYPQGLRSEQILPEAKILAVADVVEAMMTHRPYRPGLGLDAALEEISKARGTLYDPVAVDCCIALFREKGFAFE